MDVLNFGHGAFITLGAYTTTLLSLPLSGWLAADSSRSTSPRCSP
jgi:branched-chain amino acid transport system permease protein